MILKCSPLCKRIFYYSNPLLLLTVLYYFIHRHTPQTTYKPSISHYDLTRSTLLLCLPDFKNNLVQPQSIGTHLIYSSIFPFGFLQHCGPLKIGLCHLNDHSRGRRCFLSNDGSAHPLSPALSPPGIWGRGRERWWRARWGTWMRVCGSSSSWLRRGCCSGGRNRYMVNLLK